MVSSAALKLKAQARLRLQAAGGAAPAAAPAPTPVADPGLALPGTTNEHPYVEPTLIDHIMGAGNYALETGAIGADRAREGLSNLAGLPVELVNISPMLLNLIPGLHPSSGLNDLVTGEQPRFGPMTDYPVGGMEFMNDLTSGFGLKPDAPEPSDPFQSIVGRVGEEVGGSMLPVGGLLGKAMTMGLPAVRRGSSLTKMFLEQAAVDPAKFIGKETGAAVAAGTGAGVANTMFDRETTGGRAADLGGALAGVGLGAVGGGIGGSLKTLFAALTGNPKYASEIVRQNAADTLIKNSDQLGAQVDPANPNAPIDTAELADIIMRPSRAEQVVPGYQASTADRASDFGWASLENARSKGDNAGRFRARQDENTRAIDQRLTDIGPTEEPAVFRQALSDQRDQEILDAVMGRKSASAAAEQAVAPLAVQTTPAARGNTVRTGLEDARDVKRTATEDAYARADVADVLVEPADLKATIDEATKGLTAVERGLIPESTLARVRALADPGDPIDTGVLDANGKPIMKAPEEPEPVRLKEATDTLSELKRLQRAALADPRAEKGGRNAARVLGQLIDAVDGFITDNLDAEQAAALDVARATKFSEAESFTRTGDPVAAALARHEGGQPKMRDERVAGSFVNSQNMDRLLSEADTPQIRTAIREELLSRGDLSSAEKINDFLGSYGEQIAKFPGLEGELRNAASARATEASATAAEDTLRRTLGTPDGSVPGRGAVANYLRFGDERAETAMSNVVNAADPARAADELLTFVGDEPRAVEGARRAFWQVMERAARSKNGAMETADGIDPWLTKKWRTFLDQPKVVAVMDRLYRDQPEQADALREIAMALRGVQTGNKAGAAINPSGTAQQLRNNPITLAEAQAKFIDVQRGRLNPLYAVTYLAGKIAHRLVSKQAEKAYQRLLDEALLNPEVASALLHAENPANRAALARAAKGWQVYEAAGLTELLSQLDDEPAPVDDEDPVVSAVMKGAK